MVFAFYSIATGKLSRQSLVPDWRGAHAAGWEYNLRRLDNIGAGRTNT
jgi:hypothetical protein